MIKKKIILFFSIGKKTENKTFKNFFGIEIPIR